MRYLSKSHVCGDVKGMYLAITPILIYILNRPRPLNLLMTGMCSLVFTQDFQCRFVYFFIFYTSITVP